jgi:anti-sigma-K factor RskA
MTEADRNALAGEYVLGLLAPEDLAAAQNLRETDPDFAQAVRRWELRLLPIADEVPPLAPPERVWARIAAATAPAAMPASPRRIAPRRFWAFGALGAALVAVLLLVWAPGSPPGREIATLQNADGGSFVVRETRQTLQITPRNVSLPAGKVAELWVILPHQAPRAAGLFAAGQKLVTPLPAAPDGLVLAVSLEPSGGSPTGQPTGPILAKTSITKL